jgi:hypothetical protein
MTSNPLRRVARHFYDGECIEGIPITEQYLRVLPDTYLLPGIAWFGATEILDMKTATIVIPYSSPRNGALREGLFYESDASCF